MGNPPDRHEGYGLGVDLRLAGRDVCGESRTDELGAEIAAGGPSIGIAPRHGIQNAADGLLAVRTELGAQLGDEQVLEVLEA
jgi:hypothetical protein